MATKLLLWHFLVKLASVYRRLSDFISMRTIKYMAIFAMSNSKSPNFVVIIILGFTVYEIQTY